MHQLYVIYYVLFFEKKAFQRIYLEKTWIYVNYEYLINRYIIIPMVILEYKLNNCWANIYIKRYNFSAQINNWVIIRFCKQI